MANPIPNQNLALTICERLATEPDHPVIWHKGRYVSNAELLDLVTQYRLLFQSSDLSPKSHIGLFLENSPDFIAAFLACLMDDFVCVPINTKYHSDTVTYVLDKAEISLLITDKKKFTFPAHVAGFVLGQDSLPEVNEGLPFPPKRQVTDDLAVLFFTSGSTGQPKGVMISHKNLMLGVDSVTTYLPFETGMKHSAVLPMSFDAGLNYVLSAIITGGSVYLHVFFLALSHLKQLADHKIEASLAVPYIFNSLSQCEEYNLPDLKFLASTGGSMSVDIIDKLHPHAPQMSFYVMYGLTEAFRSTYLHPDDLKTKKGSIGTAIPHANILIIHPDGHLCQPDEVGEIVHTGPLVGLGYWKRDAERFRPLSKDIQQKTGLDDSNALFSGDLGYMDEDGYLYFVGRKDDMIKSRGQRIAPTEIDKALLSIEGIFQAASFGLPHPQFGQEIISVISISSDETEDIKNPAKIRSQLKEKISSFMIPDRIFYMDKMPQNSNGKIDIAKIKEELDLCQI